MRYFLIEADPEIAELHGNDIFLPGFPLEKQIDGPIDLNFTLTIKGDGWENQGVFYCNNFLVFRLETWELLRADLETFCDFGPCRISKAYQLVEDQNGSSSELIRDFQPFEAVYFLAQAKFECLDREKTLIEQNDAFSDGLGFLMTASFLGDFRSRCPVFVPKEIPFVAASNGFFEMLNAKNIFGIRPSLHYSEKKDGPHIKMSDLTQEQLIAWNGPYYQLLFSED